MILKEVKKIRSFEPRHWAVPNKKIKQCLNRVLSNRVQEVVVVATVKPLWA